MESTLIQEVHLEKKLKEIESRKQRLHKEGKCFKLTDIKDPEDLGKLAEQKRDAAFARNALLLQELDIEIGKLHTQQLFPINSRLNELKMIYLRKQRLAL